MPWRRVRQRIAAGALPALLVAAVPASAAFDPVEYERVAKTILCDCGCHPQSVHDCACARAAEMREEIRAEVAQGKSADDVILGYVARHGEAIRIAPVASGFNLLAWLGPFAALVVAVGALALVARRWVRAESRAQGDAGAAAGPAAPDEAAYHERLRREVEELR